MDEPKPKRKGRGKGKKPALVSTSIRLSVEVHEWFKTHHPHDMQSAIRAVLLKHVQSTIEQS
ncbi:hypothetical protein EB118_15905 [bacterium]|nr:hypothetical protein [bacterium]